jgi:hypothetical protein
MSVVRSAIPFPDLYGDYSAARYRMMRLLMRQYRPRVSVSHQGGVRLTA